MDGATAHTIAPRRSTKKLTRWPIPAVAPSLSAALGNGRRGTFSHHVITIGDNHAKKP